MQLFPAGVVIPSRGALAVCSIVPVAGRVRGVRPKRGGEYQQAVAVARVVSSERCSVVELRRYGLFGTLFGDCIVKNSSVCRSNVPLLAAAFLPVAAFPIDRFVPDDCVVAEAASQSHKSKSVMPLLQGVAVRIVSTTVRW